MAALKDMLVAKEALGKLGEAMMNLHGHKLVSSYFCAWVEIGMAASCTLILFMYVL